MLQSDHQFPGRLVVVACLAFALILEPVALHAQPATRPGSLAELSAAMSEGNALFEARQYDKAAAAYQKALTLKGQPDAALYTLLGDCYQRLVLLDFDNLARAILCYDQAIAADPKLEAPRARLLEIYLDDARLNPSNTSAQQWEKVESAALKVLEIDPIDRDARKNRYRAVIERWIAQGGGGVEQQKVDEAVAALTQISKQIPFDADVIVCLSQIPTRQATLSLKQNDRAGAEAAVAQMIKLVDESLAAHDDDAVMHYRAGQILRLAGAIQRAIKQDPSLEERAQRELARAAGMVAPEHPLYGEIRLYYAQQLERAGQREAAEKEYRDVLARRPDDLNARMPLAELLARRGATRLDAIEILAQAPLLDSTKHVGVKAFVANRLMTMLLFKLVDLELEVLPTVKGRPEFDVLLKDIDSKYVRITSDKSAVGSPLTLQILGRIELAKGQVPQAIQSLENSLSLMPDGNAGDAKEMRAKSRYFLATAFASTNRISQAKDMLIRAVDEWPDYHVARIFLAQLLVREGKTADARPHVERLGKSLPDATPIIRLQISVMDKQKEKQEMLFLYNKLPEASVEQMAEKVQVAQYMEMYSDSVRILDLMRAQRPNDISIDITLARMHVKAGDKTKALAIIDASIAKNPTRNELKQVRAEIVAAK